ncbi:hypothetical protein MferCBS31731_005855 [Microsporum ferrugineum]
MSFTHSDSDTEVDRSTISPAAAEDDGAAVIAELEAAMAANPGLRPVTPQLAEWEDYDTILAQNPDIANPVPGRKKEFFLSKDRWECGHEGDPVETAIERDASRGDEPTILVNDVRGICGACMDKWRRLESGGPQPAAQNSLSSSGLPSYDQAWEASGSAAPSRAPGLLLDLDDSDMDRNGSEDDYDSLSDASEDLLSPSAGPPPGPGQGANARS